MPSFGFRGSLMGDAVTVYSDGTIVHKNYIFGQEESFSEDKIAFIPEIAVMIEKILITHKADMEKIPSKLNNGTRDGSHDCFQFGKKTISSWSIQRRDLKKIKKRNPSYYEHYRDNVIYENMVLDIYDEIAEIINEYDIGVNLKIK